VIDTPAGDDATKLPAGSTYVYPATTLHRVAAVMRGERLALVGWVRSYVRDTAKRELLFDLETVRRTMFDTDGKTQAFDQLSKCSANLLRLWIDD
jgi:PKHD-type hydroxylase